MYKYCVDYRKPTSTGCDDFWCGRCRQGNGCDKINYKYLVRYFKTKAEAKKFRDKVNGTITTKRKIDIYE